MRIAVLSDIHGNVEALDAALSQVRSHGGVDEYWVLGDLVALGHAPIEVLERLTGLPNARILRGNTDRYTFAGDRPGPTLAQAEADAGLLPRLVECAGSFAWTQGALAARGWISWLEALPTRFETVLPDGTNVLAFHAAPDQDDGLGLLAGLDDERQARVIGSYAPGLKLGGHHHAPMNRRLGPHWLVNPGSIGNPVAPDLRASYAVIEADRAGTIVRHFRADYDRAAVIQRLRAQRHPGAAFIISHLSGQRPPHLPYEPPPLG